MMELFEHQKEALTLTEGFRNVAVYHDMGLGKTYTGTEIMMRYGCRVNLIVCQKSKVNDWVEHIANNYSYAVWNLTDKTDFKLFWDDCEFGKVGIINYDLIWRRKELLKLKNFTLMLDESSLIQNPQAKRTKFILKMKPSHVILLSGTPVGGKYENLWTQMHLLGWDITSELYEKQYVNWNLIEAGGVKHKIVDREDPYKNIDRLKRKMAEHGAVFKKTEECFDLPEQTITRIKVKPTEEYRKFIRTCLITVDDKELVGDTILTKMLYSRQLCGQYNPDKLQAFRDLIESTQDRLIVFYSFDDELRKLKGILTDLKRPISEVNGHTKNLTAYEEESNSVTLCQYQSASKGLNLQKCNRVIYFTLPLSSEDFEQSKKRIHRIGQDKPCYYYVLTCKGTVEERIWQTLQERKDYTDELFRKEMST